MIVQALHDHWRNTSPEGYAMTLTSGLLGMVAHVDWASLLSFTCLAASMAGGTCISLWKSYRLAQLELAEAERKLAAAERKACVQTPAKA
jgi:hypothetical protein